MLDIKKIKVCVFIHHSISDSVPYYVQIYINELSQHFDKVKVLTNNSKLISKNSLLDTNISIEYLENKGYDFGMFYRYIIKKNFDRYSELAVVNDSNILLNKLDEVIKAGRKSDSDFWGIIDSNEKPWFSTHFNNFHIQSHFIVFNKRAIKMLPYFFNSLNISKIMNENNTELLRRLVINNWEIGLTQYFITQGLSSFSFIQNKKTRLKFRTKKHNLTHTHFSELLSIGYPLLKKKVTTEKRNRYWVKKKSVKSVVRKYSNSDWDIEKIFEEITG